MKRFEEKDYKVFELFHKQWALVSAGSPERFNACTVSWGSMGSLWTRLGEEEGSIMTVYLHPARFTCDFMRECGIFTVSFFPDEQKKALGYMGSHSGRDCDKVAAAGLTPVAIGEGVTFQEANLTFVCRKLYQHQFAREDLAPEIQDYYRNNPKIYPVDKDGQWQPHWVFVGRILEVEDKR